MQLSDPGVPSDPALDAALQSAHARSDKKMLIALYAAAAARRPEAAAFFQRRAADMDRWIAGMQRLRAAALGDGGPESIADLHRRI